MVFETEVAAALVCPRCKRDLVPGAHEGARALACTGCGARYPIVGDVVRFVSADNYARSFGWQWNRYARVQVDKFNGYRYSHERFFDVTGWPARLAGESLLEVGCGAGRFTEVALETGADVYSFDYSSAVEANHANNGGSPRLHLFQADVYHMPLREAFFDRAFCFGVLQHTPDPEAAFRSIVLQLKPGGHLAFDVYKKHWQSTGNPKYLWRHVTTRVNAERLHAWIERWAPRLLRVQDRLSRGLGRKAAFALVPISAAEWPDMRWEDRVVWCVLDTFDMYAPAHDHPQTLADVRCWMDGAGLVDTHVGYGPNGVIARGRKPPAR